MRDQQESSLASLRDHNAGTDNSLTENEAQDTHVSAPDGFSGTTPLILWAIGPPIERVVHPAAMCPRSRPRTSPFPCVLFR
jgi:hypothetical protein